MRLLSMLALVGCALVGCDGKDSSTGAEVEDADGDGFSVDEDCDDADAAVNPDGTESCDEVDNDCDDVVDEGVSTTYYVDSDADGFGDIAGSQDACAPPDGYQSNADDCDDVDPEIRPGATETCDEVDEDCDGGVDEDFAESLEVWFLDSDGDGYGDATAVEPACDAPDGYVDNGDDCDDTDATINPGAEDVPEDAIDQNCDGEDASTIVDVDGDGFTTEVDCDDTDATINPDAEEGCDGVDNDCDKGVDEAWFATDFDDVIDASRLSLNGSAEQRWDGKDGYLSLTTLVSNQIGTAFLTDLHPGDVWGAGFTVDISGGSAADGMAFVFLDETDPTLLGNGGGDLGVRGFSGYAFEWDIYSNRDSGDPTAYEHVALTNTSDFNHLWYQDWTIHDAGPIEVEISFIEGDWRLWMNGIEVDNGTIAGYALSEVMFGFGAGTGLYYADHTVDDLWLGCPSE